MKTHQMFSVHTRPEKFEKRALTLKRHKMFSVCTRPVKFEKRSFHSENTSNIFRPHYTGEI